MALDPTVRARIEAANRRHFERLSNIKFIETLGPQDRENLVIRGMYGLGDNINQRAFIKELGFPLFLNTSWPELYQDLSHVTFVTPSTTLRTQAKNIQRQSPDRFKPWPQNNYTELKIHYGSRDLAQRSIVATMSRLFGGIKPKVFDLPDFKRPDSKIPFDKPVAVVRPVTIRKEWMNIARSPDPKYIREAAVLLKDAGYFIVSVADVSPGQEWIEGEEPIADLKFHHGELDVEELLGLCKYAACMVSGHGWATHAAMSLGVPMLVVGGGMGNDNRPSVIADPEFLDVSKITWLLPDKFCMCMKMDHACDKRISNFKDKAQTWLKSIL